MAASRGQSSTRWISKPRAIQKNPAKPRFFIARTAQRSRQLMPLRQNFPPPLVAMLAAFAPTLGAC
jgi:hypothetical protein